MARRRRTVLTSCCLPKNSKSKYFSAGIFHVNLLFMFNNMCIVTPIGKYAQIIVITVNIVGIKLFDCPSSYSMFFGKKNDNFIIFNVVLQIRISLFFSPFVSTKEVVFNIVIWSLTLWRYTISY